MVTRTSVWNSFMLFIKRKLQELAILLELLWIFFPGILFILLSFLVFTRLLQGKDIIALALESRYRGYFFLAGLVFWAGVTWYTGRLIAYNHDRLFQKASKVLYHAPRFMGFACFTVLIYAFMKLPGMHIPDWIVFFAILSDLFIYFLFHRIFEHIKDSHTEQVLDRFRNLVLIGLLILFLVAGFFNRELVFLICLPLMQCGFLFLVIIRRKITETDVTTDTAKQISKAEEKGSNLYRVLNWILTDEENIRTASRNELILRGEWKIFKWFNLATLVAIIIYFAAIFNLSFSRFLSPFPFALLAFGILLGVGNIVALFSTKLKINFHFIFLVLLVIAGLISEPHNVRIRKDSGEQGLVFGNRYNLHAYFNKWTEMRKEQITDSSRDIYPVFFAIADGGASRSGYWTATVLSRIEDGTRGQFSRQLFCLSGASGGSVGNAVFYASLYARSHNAKDQQHLDNSRNYLSNDFLSYTLARMLGPDFFKPLFPFDFIYDRAAALERSMESVPGDTQMGKLMATPLSRFIREGD